MSLNRWLLVRRRDLHALTLSLALTAVSCGGAQDTPAPGGDTLGAAGQGQIGGGVPPGVGGVAASAGGATFSAGGTATSAGGAPSNAGGRTTSTGGTSTRPPSNAPSCPTYDDDFLPKVHTPVCSTCHNSTARIPNWGVYSTAKASCSLIGSRVASGAMPPRSSSPLGAEQKSLVADWVRLGCPQTMAELPASCFPPPAPGGAGGAPPSSGAGGAPPSTGMGGAGGTAPSAAGAGGTSTNPPAVGTVTITRAEWDASKQTLRLEGTSSDATAMLTAEFSGRSVMLTNEGGRFRVELTGVTTNPGTVTVRSSRGAVASANVRAN